MKKFIIALFIILMIFPAISAISVEVEKLSSDEVLVMGVDRLASFDLKVKNLNGEDAFEFYNLVGLNMFPKGTVLFKAGETQNINLKISPIGTFEHRGLFTFNYFIRSRDGTESEQRLTLRVVELDDAFEIGSGEVNPESSTMQIYIYNILNFDFGEISAEFSSPFFDAEETFTLGPKERKEFTVELEKDDFKKLMAGFYTINADVNVLDKEVEVEGTIRFTEKDILTTTKKQYGFIVNSQIIKKVNEGNVIVKSETVVKKNIISRLFTSFSPEPDNVDRDGSVVYYTWMKEINPGEEMEIIVKTNWLFPLLVVLFIIAIVLLARQYSKTNLSLRKKVTFVRAKGGEFALKVSVFVQARKYVERVNIIDRLPPLVKIYERFGPEHPTRVDEKNKRLEWNFEKLEAGETRLLTYIIYSKVGVLGKFALPSATAVFEKEGKIHETESNRAFFVAEQRTKDKEE